MIVKAGSGPTANTIFAAPPEAGQTVWADFDPSEVGPNDGPNDGDKTISHIIVCPGPIVPEKTDLIVTKVCVGDAPEEFVKSLTSANAGNLSVTVDGEPILEPAPEWGAPIEDLCVGVSAEVSEGKVPALPSLADYSCEITGSPEYSVNGGDFGASASFTLLTASNTVRVRNTVDCTKVEKPTTTLKVTKEWVRGGGVPDTYPKLDSDDAGMLKVTVNDDPTGQSWDELKSSLPIGGSAVVSETKPTLAPFAGYECTVSNPTYVVNGGSAADTAEFKLLAEPNTVTVVNGQAWSATTSGHTVGATATVTEGAVTPPQQANYTCTVDVPSYVVNGGTATTTALSFALVLAPNTVADHQHGSLCTPSRSG